MKQNSDPKAPSSQGLTQQQAEALARFLNIALNSVSFYGPGHPNTHKAAVDFVAALTPHLTKVPSVVLLRAHDSLYLEQWAVDNRLNAQRVLPAFKKTGLESVSFCAGLTPEEMRVFAQVFAEYQSLGSVDKMKERLEKQGATHVRLNYVSFRKVTRDEEVVDKGSVNQNAAAAKVASGFSDLFSLSDLLERPDGIAREIVGSGGADSQVIGRLRALGDRIAEGAGAEGATAEELMRAVYQLKAELRDGLAVQREHGTIVRAEGRMLSEVERMTSQVLVQLVTEEYRGGQVSVKRLAQIIRRMLPDLRDLKVLLPQLKEGLLASGMVLADYLSLVKELHGELQSDELSVVLAESAEQVGMSAQEIAECVRHNPEEAVKLIVLASEIRNAASPEGSGLPELLSDYVERVSGILALGNRPSGQQEGVEIKEIVYALECRLLRKLQTSGLSEDVVRQTEERLGDRFRNALSLLKTTWMSEFLASEGQTAATNVLQMLEEIVEQETDLKAMRDPLRDVLMRKGYTNADIEGIYGRIADQIRKRESVGPLPKGMLTPNNTIFFLQRHIREVQRYEHPFSCIAVIPVSLHRTGAWIKVEAEHITVLLPAIHTALRKILRDLDLVGTHPALGDGIPLILMPSTGDEGMDAVRKRVTQVLDETPFSLKHDPVRIRCAIAGLSYDRGRTAGLKAFLEAMKQLAAQEVAKIPPVPERH